LGFLMGYIVSEHTFAVNGLFDIRRNQPYNLPPLHTCDTLDPAPARPRRRPVARLAA
jgi:hypothetical protein